MSSFRPSVFIPYYMFYCILIKSDENALVSPFRPSMLISYCIPYYIIIKNDESAFLSSFRPSVFISDYMFYYFLSAFLQKMMRMLCCLPSVLQCSFCLTLLLNNDENTLMAPPVLEASHHIHRDVSVVIFDLSLWRKKMELLFPAFILYYILI